MPLTRIDHLQLAMPAGGEDAARGFYGAMLRLDEVAKPPDLAARGGCWFASGSVHIHLGVEADFRPARKAHPAFRTSGFAELVARLYAGGYAVSEEEPFEGSPRVYVDDPFGNRIELISET